MKNRILITAGGTGGHVFPGLAVAHYLMEKGWEVHWLGTKEGLEAEIVPKSIPLHVLSIQSLRGQGMLRWVSLPWRLFSAVLQALRILQHVKPTLVLGMGGFVSGPGGLAAWLARYPLIIHEQNSIAGLTNRYLAYVANKVLEGFPGVFKRAIYTGNPVREALTCLPSPEQRFLGRQGPLRLLVLGGSRGAVALNTMCPVAIAGLSERPEVWHQTGKDKLEETQALYQQHGVNARVEPFIEDMAKAYAWADLVLCRSGALTVCELAAVGIGSILVPYPFAVDDHQWHNGRFLEQVGGAILVKQSGLTPERLREHLSIQREALLTMAKAAYGLAKSDAAKQMGRLCEEEV